MCSRSMLVTTAITGASNRKLRSLSSASTTISSLLPSRALVPAWFTRPPTTKVGSSPAPASVLAINEVVVVLPCEPATATPYLSRISSASISARGMTARPRRSASSTSGFSAVTAVEVTTTCASPRFSTRCPSNTLAPNCSSRAVTGESRRSEPETV